MTAEATRTAPAGPAVALVLAAITSVQIGAALAATLFDELGAEGAVLLRLALAALVLGALWRPRLREHARADLRTAALFGLVLGLMNWAFYASIARIPLGVAVTLEFVGPLGVAVATSRRRRDLVWVALAALGILLLANPLGAAAGLDPLGVALALAAGGGWAAYILLSARVGAAFPGGSGLALALVVATAVVAPAGIAAGGAALLDPALLLAGAGVALLSSVIPFSFELEALRRLPAGVFGVLMSLEPAVAALAGLVVLGQDLGPIELAAIACVVVASAGATV